MSNSLDAVFELDLVRYIDTKFYDSDCGIEEAGWLELSDLGKQFIDEIQSRRDAG